MNKIFSTVVGCFLLIAAPLSFACDYPERPSIPDGSTASKEELLAAKDAVGAFLADVDSYLTCIENAEKELSIERRNDGTTDRTNVRSNAKAEGSCCSTGQPGS